MSGSEVSESEKILDIDMSDTDIDVKGKSTKSIKSILRKIKQNSNISIVPNETDSDNDVHTTRKIQRKKTADILTSKVNKKSEKKKVTKKEYINSDDVPESTDDEKTEQKKKTKKTKKTTKTISTKKEEKEKEEDSSEIEKDEKKSASKNKNKYECTLYETVPYNIAAYLRDNLDNFGYPIDNDDTKHIINYLDRVIYTCGKQIQVSYKFGKSANSGRLYAKSASLQHLPKKIRNTLADGNYWDIDMINSGPTILKQYCEKNNIKCPHIERYVNKREHILKRVMEIKGIDRGAAKNLITSIIFGAPTDVCYGYEYLGGLHIESSKIWEVVTKEHNDYYKAAKNREDKKTVCIGGAVLSRVYQNIEYDVLQSYIKHLKQRGYQIGTLIFDGCLIKKTDKLPNFEELKQLVYDDTGYMVDVMIKPMDDKLNIDVNEVKKYVAPYIIENDTEAADIVINILNTTKQIIVSKKRYFYKKFDDANIYEEDTTRTHTEIEKKLRKIITRLDIKKKTETIKREIKISEYSKDDAPVNHAIAIIMCHIEEDDNFVNKLWESNLFKLCFRNGYYDFLEKKFKPYDNSTYTIIYIDRNYRHNFDTLEATKKYIYEEILNKILFDRELLVAFLQWIARGIAGCFEDKTYGFGIGNRQSGKGVLTFLFKKTFGSYFKEFTADELILGGNKSNDAGARRRFLMDSEFKRLFVANEIQTDTEYKKTVMDDVIIKSISGGGDGIDSRRMGENEKNIVPQARFLLLVNDMPAMKSSSTLTTMMPFVFHSQFVDEITDEHKNTDSYKFFKSDDNIKTTIMKNVDIWDAFMHIIFEHFTPNKVLPTEKMKEAREDCDSENNEKNIITELFDLGNVNYNITVSEFNKIIKDSGKMTKNKSKLLILSLGVTEDKKYIDGKQTRIYIGIKDKLNVINDD